MEKKSLWESWTPEMKQSMTEFCEGYKAFMSKCKTERECVDEMIAMAEAAGYTNLFDAVKAGKKRDAQKGPRRRTCKRPPSSAQGAGQIHDKSVKQSGPAHLPDSMHHLHLPAEPALVHLVPLFIGNHVVRVLSA